MQRDIIVIGMSLGGVKAIKELIAPVSADIDASIFIVWHLAEDAEGLLPTLLASYGKLPAAHAEDGEKIQPGRIYVAPPDRHMLLEKGVIRLSRGPKENRFRPAIDPLFRSAAQSYGPRVIGIVLSGSLDDGCSGLWTIKSRGGLAVVQDPIDAEAPSMPINAIRSVEIDHTLSAKAIGEHLERWTSNSITDAPEVNMQESKKTEIEVKIAAEQNAVQLGVKEIGELSSFTCPDCKGVMLRLKDGSIIRFRCHTGHAYTAETFLATVSKSVEDTLWTAERSLDELIMLLRYLAGELANRDESSVADLYTEKAADTQTRSDALREIIFEHLRVTAEELRVKAA